MSVSEPAVRRETSHAPTGERRRPATGHGMTLPDTSHLAPEDAELLRALYLERNAVSRGEAARVRWNATTVRGYHDRRAA